MGASNLPVLNALGFEAGEEGNRGAWQNFTNVCKESFDYLARNLSEKADDPLEASKLASEAFGAALKKVKSERLSVSKQRTGKMVERTGQKVVNRRVALVLGMICILLVAALVAVILVYKPMANTSALESQLAEKDSTIASLNSSVTALQNLVARYVTYFNESYSNSSDLDAQIASLNAQIAVLNNYLNLNASGLLLNNQAVNQAAGANTTVFNDVLPYAGYVSVDVQSNSATTYVEVLYSAFGVNYDENQTVGTSGTAAFPVLPGTIEIRIGNTDTSGTVTGTVTATYHF